MSNLKKNQQVSFDYDKLAEAIVKAEKLKREEADKELEEERKEKIATRRKALKMSEYYDENGKAISKFASIKLIYYGMLLKEEDLKDSNVLDAVISSTLRAFFGFFEFLSYLWAAIHICKFALKLANFILLVFNNSTQDIVYFLDAFSNFLWFALFAVLGRVFLRMLRVECIHNKDKNYMLNFFAVIIAVIALVVSFMNKGGV